MKIFFQVLFVWQENDFVFSSKFEKKALKQQQQKIAPYPHTRTLKFNMLRVQYMDHRERVHLSFIKQ